MVASFVFMSVGSAVASCVVVADPVLVYAAVAETCPPDDDENTVAG